MQERYHMVESSSAYFVAYRHILERLQDTNEETMPFKNYIVFCEHEIDKVMHVNLVYVAILASPGISSVSI
jgi:hypothetical protein